MAWCMIVFNTYRSFSTFPRTINHNNSVNESKHKSIIIQSLPVWLCVLGQIFQCWIQVHEASGFVHYSSSCQSARPTENTRHPDSPLPASHSFPTYRWVNSEKLHNTRIYFFVENAVRNIYSLYNGNLSKIWINIQYYNDFFRLFSNDLQTQQVLVSFVRKTSGQALVLLYVTCDIFFMSSSN